MADRGVSERPLTLGVMPPKITIPGSPANYWQLSVAIVNNIQLTMTPLDHSVALPTEPHWYADGVVEEVISEGDGDVHVWLSWLDAAGAPTKDRLACEITPQQKLAPPPVGQKVRVAGIFRYDAQHRWFEIHPVDWWEVIE